MTHFNDFGLSDALNISLEKMGYAAPTPIQEKAIPFALDGRDILGSAQTGTGKTAAFSIPLVESILRSEQGSALVLTPTRELAKQVLDVITQLLGHKSPIKTAFIIGGESMGKQFAQLKARPRIIVGTPGRVNDHLERGTLRLNDAHFLVLDETDRMLDMGFGVQLDKILKFMPKERQTLMFSATMPREIIALSGKYLTNPQRIAIGEVNKIAVNIEQEVMNVPQERKYDELLKQLGERSGSVIVFVKTKHAADRIARNLNRDDVDADALHGDLKQNARTRVMMNFRNQKFRVLVATDIAARGLDVPHIEHVINFDLPQVPEDYIHRMGRTARAGAKGSAICFIAPHDVRQWKAIERLINPDAARAEERNARPSSRKPNSKFRPDGRGDSRSDSRFEGKRRNDRPFEKRDGEKRSAEVRPFKKRNDDNRGNSFESNEGRQIEADKKAYGTPRSNAFRSKPRPQQDGAQQDRPFQERKKDAPRGNKAGANPNKGKPKWSATGKPKAAGEESYGNKPMNRPAGAKPASKKAFGDKPAGKKPFVKKARPAHKAA